jgi:exopolysaccharide biosynthesis protein
MDRRKRWLYGLIGALALLPTMGRTHPAAIGYSLRYQAGTRVHLITVNLNDKDVKVVPLLAQGGLGRAESFRSIVSRARPDAAITGTYFGTRGLVPVGDLVVDGTFVHLGRAGTGLAITRDNTACLIPRQQGRQSSWADYETVICSGPSLVRGGRIVLDPKAEGFTSGAHFRLASRTAVGITAHNKLLLAAVSKPIHLGRMARIMKELGAVEAISLDGGSSAALSYGNSVIIPPARRLTHVLAVYSTRSKYHQVMTPRTTTAG